VPPHPWNIDFPHLMLRAKAVKFRKGETRLRDKVLSSTDLVGSIAGETHEYTYMYPGMAKSARDEGFDEIADWFETLAKAERSHANKFQRTLDALAE
jgi:rubrerythrin